MRSISQKKQSLKSVLANLSTIIFDLGGVILNLDVKLSVKAFAKLSGLEEKEIYSRFLEEEWSYAFEKGEIDAPMFRNEVRKSLKVNLLDEQIDKAWNAMLIDLPVSSLQLVASLKHKYQLYVLVWRLINLHQSCCIVQYYNLYGYCQHHQQRKV